MICKEALEKKKKLDKIKKDREKKRNFLIDNKICPECGCDIILLHTRHTSFSDDLECEDCGFEVKDVRWDF